MACCTAGAQAQPADPDLFERMKSLVGEWQADLPGYGQINNSIRLVSKGTAIEETIGTPADNETSVYARDGGRVLLTHFCALTPDGHQARLAAAGNGGNRFEFTLVGAGNLHGRAAPHMRRVVLTFQDGDHFNEKWTMSKNGVDTVFDLGFVRLGLH